MNKLTIFTLILIVLIFICVVVVHQVYSPNTPPPEVLTQHPLVPEYTDLMVLFLFLYIAYIISALCQNYGVPTPYGGFVLIVAFIWGALAYYDPVFFLASHIWTITSTDVMYVYVPVIMFNLSFCMDVPIFIKTLPQILVIGVPVTLTTAGLFGVLSTYILSTNWKPKVGLLLGIFCMPHHPHSVTSILKQQSTRTKQISVLLEGESLLVFFLADISYKILQSKLEGFVVRWYQITAVVLRVLVLGIITGYVLGAICRYALRKMYSNRISVFIICFGAPFYTYTISELYLSGCGSISVMVMGLMLGQERTVLPKHIETFLIDFWDTGAYIMDVVVCMKAAMIGALLITRQTEWKHYPLLLVTYLTYYMSRFLCFLVFSPIISRLGYGMDLKNMIVCVWGGLKSPFGLEIVAVFIERKYNTEIANMFFFFILGLYFLSVFINGSFTLTILDFLGLREISLARQINMNNCMKHIFLRRERTIAILKMDRFLADTNWPILLEYTNMKHPYKMETVQEEDEGFSLGYRFTFCGDCKKEILQEPSPREMKEMVKEAKMRVLKAKKMSYSRQYENGMMTKQAIRVLNQTVELAVDSEDAEIKVGDLHKRFIEENLFVRFIRSRAAQVEKRKECKSKAPRTYWRRLCYHVVVRDKSLDKIMFFVIAAHLVVLVIDIMFFPSLVFPHKTGVYNGVLGYAITGAEIIFALIYLIEFVMKIMAYSWIYVCAHGFRTYFQGFWNLSDFTVMMVCILVAVLRVFNIQHAKYEEFKTSTFQQVVSTIQILRVLRLLRIFEIFYPDIIRYFDKSVDIKMTFTYELGKSYINGEAEILAMLPYMIDNKKIRTEMEHKAENDRLLVLKLIGIVQKERPWIAITVKTTQAIRTILNSMKEAINELKGAGWVDIYEHEKLLLSMDDLSKKVNSIKQVEPSPPKVIFKEVAWMAGDEAVINFLFENVTVKTFEPGEVVFAEGDVADGIYIVVTGLFMLTYKPHKRALKNLRKYGLLPIVDYISGAKFEDPATDYIVSGNCIGELSTLTDRCYDCEITADVHSQVYALGRSVLNKAKELSPDGVTGLECRIWKAVSVRLAVPILLSVPAYQAFSQDVIKYALERAFVPDLRKFKVFAVTSMIEDIILIEGKVSDFNTQNVFVAPCYIPRTVQKLVLPKSGLTQQPKLVNNKLLIIPTKDVDEYDVMMEAEETCELVETASATKCLQHAAKNRIKHKRTRTRGGFRRGRTFAVRKSHSGSLTSVTASLFSKSSRMMHKDPSVAHNKSGVSQTSVFFSDVDEEQETSSVAYPEEPQLSTSHRRK